jgi:hypothetical protein
MQLDDTVMFEARVYLDGVLKTWVPRPDGR